MSQMEIQELKNINVIYARHWKNLVRWDWMSSFKSKIQCHSFKHAGVAK